MILNPFLDKEDDRDSLVSYDETICAICFYSKANALYKPCNHGGMCKSCSIDNFKKYGLCPFCRSSVKDVLIYLEGEDGMFYETEQYPNFKKE